MIAQLLDQQAAGTAGDGQILEAVLKQAMPQLIVRQQIEIVHPAAHLDACPSYGRAGSPCLSAKSRQPSDRFDRRRFR